MDAILLAAGVGKRTRLNFPKQLLMLGGKPLFIHVLEILKSTAGIDKLILTVIPDMTEVFNKYIEKYNLESVICVSGGKTRQESVYNALKFCDSERVLIHVASRPFITSEHIIKLMSYNSDAVIPCISAIYAMIDKDFNYVNRSNTLNIQVPQIFKTEILKKAHELGKGKNYSEDSELVYDELGIKPTIVEGFEDNIKITTPIDVKLAELIFNNI